MLQTYSQDQCNAEYIPGLHSDAVRLQLTALCCKWRRSSGRIGHSDVLIQLSVICNFLRVHQQRLVEPALQMLQCLMRNLGADKPENRWCPYIQ